MVNKIFLASGILVIVIIVIIIVVIFMIKQKTEKSNSFSNLPMANKVVDFAAKELKVGPKEITIIEIKEAEWPDACLGLVKAGEFCAQVITPGYSVLLRARSIEYRYRTDKEGIVIIQDTR